MTCSGIAAPPDMQRRRVEVSAESALSHASIALYIVGTPWKIVMPSRAMISSALSGSNRGIIEIIARLQMPAFSVHVWPKLWNSGSAPSSLSSSVISPSVDAATVQFLYRLAWVSSAPLGLPVVPDV